MKLPALALLLLAPFALAQEKPGTPRKTMTFQPGEKAPGGVLPASSEPITPTASVENGPVPLVKAFFAQLQTRKIDEAYAELTKNSRIAERPEEMKALKAKTTEAIEVFGDIQGYEGVETRVIGRSLLRQTYLSLGKEFPLRWRFYFYLSGGVWRLVDLRVDDRLTGIFEEADEPRTSLDSKTP